MKTILSLSIALLLIIGSLSFVNAASSNIIEDKKCSELGGTCIQGIVADDSFCKYRILSVFSKTPLCKKQPQYSCNGEIKYTADCRGYCCVPTTPSDELITCSTNQECYDEYKSCYYHCTNNKCAQIFTIAPLPNYPNCENEVKCTTPGERKCQNNVVMECQTLPCATLWCAAKGNCNCPMQWKNIEVCKDANVCKDGRCVPTTPSGECESYEKAFSVEGNKYCVKTDAVQQILYLLDKFGRKI